MTTTMTDAAVEPLFHTGPKYHTTMGPEVGDLARMAGFGPDPEQQVALDDLFGVDRNGLASAYEFAVIACRQNLKTGLFKQASLGWLFLNGIRLVVWSAHEFATAQEAFRDMEVLLQTCPDFDREIKKIHRGNGDEAIELFGDRRLIFKARTNGGGRGLTGDRVVLDESFALKPAHMGALLPTLSAVKDPQLVYGSSAGHDGSSVLRRIRDRGRVGSSDRLAYLEYGTVPGECESRDCTHELDQVGCMLDREALWRAGNPQLGKRISVETIRAERQALPPLEFARERMGWWDEPDALDSPFGLGQWEDCQIPEVVGGVRIEEPTKDLRIAVAMPIDQSHVSIGAAARRPDGKKHLGVVDRRRGSTWCIDVLADMQRRTRVPIVIDGRGPAAVLIAPLERAKVDVTVASTADVLDACAGIYDAVQDRGVTHYGCEELEDAVAGAAKRAVGDRWAWGRKTSSFDVSMLETVTLAAHFVDVQLAGAGFNIW